MSAAPWSKVSTETVCQDWFSPARTPCASRREATVRACTAITVTPPSPPPLLTVEPFPKSAPPFHFQRQPSHGGHRPVLRSLPKLAIASGWETTCEQLTTSGLSTGQASTVADSPAPLLLTQRRLNQWQRGDQGPTNESAGACATARWFLAVPAFQEVALSGSTSPRSVPGHQTARGGCPASASLQRSTSAGDLSYMRADQVARRMWVCVTLRLFTGAVTGPRVPLSPVLGRTRHLVVRSGKIPLTHLTSLDSPEKGLNIMTLNHYQWSTNSFLFV